MNVLVADDDAVTRRVLSTMLSRWGYQVTCVADGAAAWEALSRPDAPRLALLDWEMPLIDGPEVCRRVRNEAGRPYTYLMLLTGRETRSDRLDGLFSGADEYVTKPFDEAELAARLRIARRITGAQETLRATSELLRHRATHDALTGVLNRAGIVEVLEAELAHRGRPVSILLLDLDHFKRVNDTWGHAAGDAVLREAARRIAAVLRPTDRLGRLGGEEFLVVLPECELEGARRVAERVRMCVADAPFLVQGRSIPLTLSAGLACANDTDQADELLARIDRALYRAKGEGRNRIVEDAVYQRCAS